MKTAILTATLALTLFSSAAFAQAVPSQGQAQPRMHNPHRAAMRIGHELNLPPDQTARLEPILAERNEKVQAIRANASLTDAQRHMEMKRVAQRTRMEMANVLSPDQLKQLKAMRRNRMQQQGAAAPTGV